ncbi:MAG: ABC transporter permease [Nitrososphaeria archaeon]
MWESFSQIFNFLSNLSKRRVLRNALGIFSVIFFVFFVILPSIFVASYVPANWHDISLKIFSSDENTRLVVESLEVSIFLSILVSVLDIVFGIPLAFFVVRSKGKTASFMNTLIEIPLITPTSALGLSVVLFWPMIAQGTVSAYIILVLLHVAFTIPYMVRSVSAALTDFNISYEVASRTLGAKPFTAIRTITLPLVKAGILTGTILAIARSLSETGATSIALTLSQAGRTNTAPTLIFLWRTLSVDDPTFLYAGAFVSLLLILISFLLFFGVKFLIGKLRLPFSRVYLPLESELSTRRWANARNLLASIFFLLVALVPSTFTVVYGLSHLGILSEQFSLIGGSIFYSFTVAIVVTIVDLVFSTPLAVYIARGSSRLKHILDYLIEIPIVFPSVAVGMSLNLFWLNFVSKSFPFFSLSSLALIIFAHVAITYSFTVRAITNAMNALDQSFEEAAKTLGSTPFSTFFNVVYPQIKSSIFAGAIFAFTRSLDETGATLAVAPEAITAPVIIVDFVKKGMIADAGVASLVLILFSYAILLVVKKLGGRHGQS